MRKSSLLLVAFVVISMLLTTCGATPVPTAVPTQTSTAAPTQPPKPTATQAPTQPPPPPTSTSVPPTPTSKAPTVGGSLVLGCSQEPDTLDPQVASLAVTGYILRHIGGTLLTLDTSARLVPYLAESWTSSADGITWDFVLRRGVKFHDGTPCTAADWAWTFQRALDPDTRATVARTLMGPLASAEATGDYTLRLKLSAPYFSFAYALADHGLQVMSRQWVARRGDQIGREPMSVGPYVFKEWKTGVEITVERNGDYSWAPSFAHAGPAYIQTLRFRFLVEKATAMAGLEAGELDGGFLSLDVNDAKRLRDTGRMQVFEGGLQGLFPYIVMNLAHAPFDDLRVRKALNMVVNRELLVKAAVLGAGSEQRGPMSPSMLAYWPGIEKLGYGYDLPQAQGLLKEAGLLIGSSGLLEKDGKPVQFVLKFSPLGAKVAEILKEQFRAAGIDLRLQQEESGVFVPNLIKGNYELGVLGVMLPEAGELMFATFHSSQAGAGLNVSGVKDAALDAMLTATRATTDPAGRQEAVNRAAQYIVEKAYIIPLYSPKQYVPVSSRVKGAVFVPAAGNLVYLWDAYVEK